MTAPRTVIVGGARTPMGRYQGSLAAWSAVDLGAEAIRAALNRSGLEPDLPRHVVFGQVLQAGLGQNPARQAAVAAGIPLDVPAQTVNSVCLSGTAAITQADLLIRSGQCDVVVAGGMESMTNAPHVLPGARGGLGYGSRSLLDVTQNDGLVDAFSQRGMGEATEDDTRRAGWSRSELDAFSLRSHALAHEAAERGTLAEEIVPVSRADRRGRSTVVDADEGIRPDSTLESLGRLRPAFASDGLLTAASSSPISDGAAALVLMSADRADRLGLTPLAWIRATASVAGPDTSLLAQPARAAEAALARAGLGVDEIDRVEINEAFASVALESARRLGVVDERLNPAGGAIALGHPLGMSGARLVLTIALAIGSGRARTGVAALCGGGGQGDAIVLERI